MMLVRGLACTIFLLLRINQAICADAVFSYANAENWGAKHPTCEGNEQSPINIVTDHTLYKKYLDYSFTMSDSFFQPITTALLENTGQTYKLTPTEMDIQILKGAGLEDFPYTFDSITFHFGGRNNMYGSEHAIDGHRYPAEMQFLFTSDEVAETGKGSFVIWSFFLEILTDDERYRRRGSFDTIIKELSSVQNAGISKYVNGIKLSSLVPIFDAWSFNRVYSYNGSLSAPPCTENARWFIFKDPLPISEQQYLEMVQGKNQHSERLVNNYRPIQPIGDRLVARSGLANKKMRVVASAVDTRMNYLVSIAGFLALKLVAVQYR